MLEILMVPALVILFIGMLYTILYGIYLSFRASIIFGIIVLFIHPLPFIIGAVMLLFKADLAKMFIDFLTK